MTQFTDQLERLGAAPVFGELPAGTLASVAERATIVTVAAGADLMEQGADADSVMVLLSGRLRAFVLGPDGAERAVGDIGPGELVGEMALLSDAKRTATVRAVRDSRLVAVDRATFEEFLLTDPGATAGMARLLATRLDRANTGRRTEPKRRTVAVVPTSAAISPSHVDQLLDALAGIVKPTVVRSSDVREVEDGRLGEWLNRAELDAHLLVYIADSDLSGWTRRCLRQADHIVVVDVASSPAASGRFVETLVGATTGPVSPSLDVVMVNPPGVAVASGGSRWVATNLKIRIHQVRDRSAADFERVARTLTQQDISLVLSGGGARGMAHVGVIRAFEESGIPIDAVGGTSFGGIIAGYLASGLGWREISDELWRTVGRPGAPVDVTLPMVAVSKGEKLMRVLESSFGDRLIEDLWIRMFCMSSNLSTGRPLVHANGSLRMALRASVAIPGVFPPVSTGDNELLVDGGIMNNLPIDVMLDFSDGGPLVAVNLRSNVVLDLEDLPGDGIVSGWRTALRRFAPAVPPRRMPGLVDVLLRSSETGASLAARVLEPRADYVMHPPVEGFGLLEFGALDRLLESGYAYTMDMLERWAEEGRPLGVIGDDPTASEAF